MRSRKSYLLVALFAILECILSTGCVTGQASVAPKNELTDATVEYRWSKVTDSAAFPGAYNFPVFAVRDQMWAFHPKGNWYSVDGRNWIESSLPLSGLISGYQRYIQFNDAVYALGTMTGNYLDLHLTSRIARTADFKHWETIAESSELPARVFYGAVVFRGKIWLMGGYDGTHYYNDVWNSSDGVHWSRIAEKTAWSPRTIATTVVFKDKIWIFGGDVIDGQSTNGKPAREVWTSTDGVNWKLETDRMNRMSGGSPIVFDDKLWLVGANRDGNFSRAVLVSDDGLNWKEEQHRGHREEQSQCGYTITGYTSPAVNIRTGTTVISNSFTTTTCGLCNRRIPWESLGKSRKPLDVKTYRYCLQSRETVP